MTIGKVVVVAWSIEVCGHQAYCINAVLPTRASASLMPAILAMAYHSFVDSRAPVRSSSSRIGCLANLGYMQLLPRNSSRRVPACQDASITLVWILRFCSRKSEGLLRLASMPPTVAAASTTTSGLFAFIHVFTSWLFSRSSC